MIDVLLKVEHLSKCFKIYAKSWDRAREWVSLRRRKYHQDFWALQDISFEIRKGDFFGIIGENGSGKSTLLKIITGILTASSGNVECNGRILSLLELGRDFNFELTGRQNVVLSSELLGFSPDYLKNRLTDIQEFAELGEFFDRPMKLYSSGMKSRLAFALFAFLDCDLLILDEVLAVGDIFFQQKCFARLEQLIEQQTTIVLVTHNMDTVQQYCDQIVLLHRGQNIFQGEPRLGITEYNKLHHQSNIQSTISDQITPSNTLNRNSIVDFANLESVENWPDDTVFNLFSSPTDTDYPLVRYAICDHAGNAKNVFFIGETAYIFAEFLPKITIASPSIGLNFFNRFNVKVYGKASHLQAITAPPLVSAGNSIQFAQTLKLDVQADQYVLGFFLLTLPPTVYQCLDSLSRSEVTEQAQICAVYDQVTSIIVREKQRLTQDSHMGLCNLPGVLQLSICSAPEPSEPDN
ncbi:MAG: ABC transporter ATP-binding protein [Spirulinaceae cyanobacterium]